MIKWFIQLAGIYDIDTQNRRQKVVNNGALRLCGGALRSCRGGLVFKFDKISTNL